MADLSTPINDGQSEQTAENLITMTAKDGGNVDHAGAIIDHIDIWTTAIERKSSAGRGTSNKFSLYGIKKLRELILELAVRGKLVPQDVNDEPASVLLERIAAEKAQLVKDKKIKKPKALPEIGEDEKPFELPVGWLLHRLVDLSCVITKGTTPTSVGFAFEESGVNFIKIENVSRGRINLSAISQYISIEANEVLKRSSLDVGDVLFSIAGTIGKTCVVVEEDLPANTNQALAIIRGTDLVFNVQFLLIQLNSFVAGKTRDKARGGAMPNVSLGDLNELIAVVPPLEEQHRIVAKVDELMSLCDALEAQTEASIAAHQTLVETLLKSLIADTSGKTAMDGGNVENAGAIFDLVAEHFDTLFTTEASIDTLKQTILQLAVMGKLVEQDPNDEPAAKLLERIAAEKARLIKDGKIKKQKPLPAITDEEKPFELPEGWEWCRLPDLGELARGKSKHRPRNDPKLYQDGTIPLVQTGDVARSSGIIKTYTAQYNEVGLAQSQLWPKGTLCITIAANIADTAILGFDACFPDSVVGYTPFDSKIPTKYFDYFIRTAKANLERFAPSTAQKNINLEILSQVLVPCPPEQEFIRVVARIDELMALCDQLKTRLSDAQTTQLHLTDAIIEQVTGNVINNKNEIQEEVPMKIITPLTTTSEFHGQSEAVLAGIIRTLDDADAKSVWSKSGLTLPDFYKQLKKEIDAGFVNLPSKADFL